MPISSRSKDIVAEAMYALFRREVTREEMEEMIHRLLSDDNLDGVTKGVAIRMAMIFNAEEGN